MDIIELLKAAVIGIVEGLTEWLPISSTGHMILVDEFIKLDVSAAFWEMFLVVIQLGAIMAVIILYFHRLNPFSGKKSSAEKSRTLRLWGKVIIACIPAAIIGILLDDWMEANAFNAVVVAIALIVYGIAFIIIERVHASRGRVGSRSSRSLRNTESTRDNRDARSIRDSRTSLRAQKSLGAHARVSDRGSSETAVAATDGDEVDRITIPLALGIGAFQCLAIVPGTSRSGSTILGGLILGVPRQAATEFSFFLAIPVMLGWSLLKVVKFVIIDKLSLSSTELGVLLVGCLVAFVVSVFAIRFLIGYIKKHDFTAFGWYRIILGVLVLIYFAATGALFAVGA